MNLRERILLLVNNRDGLTDREITDAIIGKGQPPQKINGTCRKLADNGLLVRRKDSNGKIRNCVTITGQSYLRGDEQKCVEMSKDIELLTEDALKAVVCQWLIDQGWQAKVAWGRTHGIDISAFRKDELWVIEVKGQGSLDAMRVNYFLAILGEILQRMDEPTTKYSIALPDIFQFRNLWERLPRLAKDRLKVTALFVSNNGNIDEVF